MPDCTLAGMDEINDNDNELTGSDKLVLFLS
jgi:hypothetical protein